MILPLVLQLPAPAAAPEPAGLADAGRSATLPSSGPAKVPPRVSVVPAQRTKTWPLNVGRGLRPRSLASPKHSAAAGTGGLFWVDRVQCTARMCVDMHGMESG